MKNLFKLTELKLIFSQIKKKNWVIAKMISVLFFFFKQFKYWNKLLFYLCSCKYTIVIFEFSSTDIFKCFPCLFFFMSGYQIKDRKIANFIARVQNRM